MNFDRRLETITAPGVSIDVFLVPWDSEIFGYPVAQIERISLTGDGDANEGIPALSSWFEAQGVRLASCRLDSRALRESMLLEAHGFRFVELVYSPYLAPIPGDLVADPGLTIAAADSDDLPLVEAIAEAAFETGRFRLDWRIEPDASARRYRSWVRSSFSDRRQQVLKATVAGEVVGFFVVEERPDSTVYWHLTAIAPASQGKGIGKRLWRAMVSRHARHGLQRIETTISAHNTAVMNIYAGLGFRFGAPRMTLHWVRK